MTMTSINQGFGRFLLAGCGSIGKRHLDNLRRLGINDVLAFDPREDRRAEVRDRWQVETTEDFAGSLRRDVGVVLVCPPTSLHVPMALEAARAGCHLFIEKPISHDGPSCSPLLQEIEHRNLRSLVGCNFRFDRGLREAKRLIEEGALGNIVSARAQFGQYLPDWHPWEDYRQSYSAKREMGGGVLLDRIHEIDYTCWLLGKVNEVAALTGRLSHLEIDSEDVAEILLKFESGAMASVHMDYVRRSYDCSLEVTGDQGTLRWSYQNRTLEWYTAAERRWRKLDWPEVDVNDMYLAQMRHFLAVLGGSEPSEQEAADAYYLLTVAMAVKRSAATRTFVTL
jgi:predicted dehydrogenase